MYKGNNTISSVIKGSSNIAKILFNNSIVWEKSQQPTILDLEKDAVRFESGKRYVTPNLSLQSANTYNTYWIEVPSNAQILALNASGILTSATGVRCAYTNDYTNDTAEKLFSFGYNVNNPVMMVDKKYRYIAISIFKTSLPATFELESLQLKHFEEGFISSSTGAIAFNPTYPRAVSSPLILFERGKTYKLTTDLSATKTDDGVRFRIYGTDDSYKMNLGASQIITNAYATFEALDYAGKANFYVAKEILITPKQDFKARIMYIDSNYVSKFKIEENLM